jgi:hypothetical protein
MTKPQKRIGIPHHSKPPVEAALAKARTADWLADYPRAHWGIIYCPFGHPQCRISIYGTPRVPEAHGRDILRKISLCPGANE